MSGEPDIPEAPAQPEKLYRVVHYRPDGSQSVAATGKSLEAAEEIRDKFLEMRIFGRLLIEPE